MNPEQTVKTFWTISEDNGKLTPEILDIYGFLSERGFRKRTIQDEIEVYRQNGHFISQNYSSDQINEIIQYLEKEYTETIRFTVEHVRKDDETFTYTPKSILEKLVKYGWGKIFAVNNWNHLTEMNVDMKRHTKDKAFFYFKNGFVEVTAAEVKLLPYSKMNGKYVFRDHLIEREVSIIDVDDAAERDFAARGLCFLDFLTRTAGVVDEDNITDDQASKFRYLMALIGFLLHDYKQQGLTDFCVILCDDNTGGSGKGIIIQAIQELTSLCVIDCRKEVGIFDPDKLTERTRVKVYNDVQPHFNFGTVYNEITDGGTIRHMHGAPRPLSYADTWKTMITSNYIIRGNSGPDQRRQRIFSMYPFFTKDLSIQDHYKHSFFSNDWNERDWNFFYNTMFRCVQMWLSSNYKVGYEDQEYNLRRLEAEYPLEFREYVDGLQRGMYHETGGLFWGIKNKEEYKSSPFVRKLTANFFGRLLTKYLDEMKVKWHKKKNRSEIYIEK